jgi:hypothetical protein
MLNDNEVEVDGRAAAVIAAGMQAVALADGHAHPRELELIAAFRADLPEDVDPSGVVLDNDATRDLFVRFLAVVALVDGDLTSAETATIHELAEAHGIGRQRVAEIVLGVKKEMLSMFSGVKVFRDQAMEVAEFIGVDKSDAAEVLDH